VLHGLGDATLMVPQIVEKRGDLPKALELYEQALEITPGNKMARFRKVRVMIGMKQYDVSLPVFPKILRLTSFAESTPLTRRPLQDVLQRSERHVPPR
jgi:tetratricopeptide (TPR) repeat protein